MNKKLHSFSQEPGPDSNLDLTPQLVQTSSAFLFEPERIVPFDVALNWQKDFQRTLMERPFSPQAVWLLQHEPCYTLGRGSDKKNLLFDEINSPAPLYRIDRGGEVTHHAPGQIVGYFVLDLNLFKKDLLTYYNDENQTYRNMKWLNSRLKLYIYDVGGSFLCDRVTKRENEWILLAKQKKGTCVKGVRLKDVNTV